MVHGDGSALAALEDLGEWPLLTCLRDGDGNRDGNDFPGRSLEVCY